MRTTPGSPAESAGPLDPATGCLGDVIVASNRLRTPSATGLPAREFGFGAQWAGTAQCLSGGAQLRSSVGDPGGQEEHATTVLDPMAKIDGLRPHRNNAKVITGKKTVKVNVLGEKTERATWDK